MTPQLAQFCSSLQLSQFARHRTRLARNSYPDVMSQCHTYLFKYKYFHDFFVLCSTNDHRAVYTLCCPISDRIECRLLAYWPDGHPLYKSNIQRWGSVGFYGICKLMNMNLRVPIMISRLNSALFAAQIFHPLRV